MQLSWDQDDRSVVCRDEQGVIFSDSLDHWSNGVLRLLHLDEAEGRAWVERAGGRASDRFGRSLPSLSVSEKLDVLAETALRPGQDVRAAPDDGLLEECEPLAGVHPDAVFVADLGGPEQNFAVVGSRSEGLGWLVAKGTGKRPSASVEYEQPYFQGGGEGLGYGDYLGQRGWREEKAGRQLRQIEGIATYFGVTLGRHPRVLDVGSGFGFFRKAADAAGWKHVGVEVSGYANAVAEELYGFSAFEGDLDSYVRTEPESFDVVTMWDLLEHVPAPGGLVASARQLLRPGGLLLIRTPNLDAAEHAVFGASYHSFKAEHLFYFSPRSLVRLLEDEGLELGLITSQSHLLRGFLGDRTAGLGATLLGSDLFAAAIA